MKNFKRKGAWLDQLSPEIQLIYLLFLVFALVGQGTFLFMSVYRVGMGYDAIVRHYRGDEGMNADEAMSFPKEPIELLEVTHFHAYIEGIVLLVLAHLFVAAPVSKAFKRGIIVLSFGSTFLDLASPWLIRFVAPSFAYGQMAAWIIMGVSYIPLTLTPAYSLIQRRNKPAS